MKNCAVNINVKIYQMNSLNLKFYPCYFRIVKKTFLLLTETTGQILQTRLLGRFAPIFYFNCEHVLIVNIEKQRRKKFREFYKEIADFQDFNKFYKNKKLLNTNFFYLDHS